MTTRAPEDDLTIPAFLDRKLNPIHPATPEEIRAARAIKREPKIIWPRKKNWRKIEERRRKAEKAMFKGFTFTQRRGQ